MSGRFNYSLQGDPLWQSCGEAMIPSASASSHYTNDSGYSSLPTSSPIMGSTGDFENPGFNSEYNYQRYDSHSYQPAATPTSQSVATYLSSYDSTPREHRQPTNPRPTPISLGWDLTQWAIKDFYDLEVPTKENQLKEPVLVLDSKYPDTESTPRRVYLDKSRDATKHCHPCMFPGDTCWKSRARPAFGRSADLLRHYAHVHARKQPQEMYCDYPKCTRARDPFTRKDHYRDHLRDYHKEDMSRPNKGKRSPKSPKEQNWNISFDWWRCSKCLERRFIKDHGWKCCGSECEEERRNARLNGRSFALDKTPETKSEQNYSMKMEVDTSVQPFPECSFCQGGEMWNERDGWTLCNHCSPAPAQVPVLGQFVSSYSGESLSGKASQNDTLGYQTSARWDSRSRNWGYTN